MTQQEAEILALRAASYLGEHIDTLEAFLRETGMQADDLRNQLQESWLQAGVLDFLLNDERRLIDFCSASDIRPESIAEARRSLPGGYFGDN